MTVNSGPVVRDEILNAHVAADKHRVDILFYHRYHDLRPSDNSALSSIPAKFCRGTVADENNRTDVVARTGSDDT